jgi:hypothetical protein
MSDTGLASIFDKYGGVLYGIALQICPTEKQAELVLVKTLRSLSAREPMPPPNIALCMQLIHLIIKTAKSEGYYTPGWSDRRLKLFEDSPLLRRLFCEQQTLAEFCLQTNMPLTEALKKVQWEFARLVAPKHALQ